jgi:hypothetical protein
MRGEVATRFKHQQGTDPFPEGMEIITPAQRRYLARGLEEPGGKLPLFDEGGREISRRTIEACLAHGWAEPWIRNPVKLDWLVCRLTDSGYRVLGKRRSA